jgi:hypothetical protein
MYNDIQNGTSGENIKNKTKRWQYAYALLGWSLSYLSKSEMATTIPHKFNIVRFQRPELIPDIEKFLLVSIFKMATTMPHKFNIVRFQRHFICE